MYTLQFSCLEADCPEKQGGPCNYEPFTDQSLRGILKTSRERFIFDKGQYALEFAEKRIKYRINQIIKDCTDETENGEPFIDAIELKEKLAAL